jgi:DNA-binding transcriptional MerR regulator
VYQSDEFIALGEAARILRASQELTRRLADRGDLPSSRLSNGHRIFRRDDVERLRVTREQRRAG